MTLLIVLFGILVASHVASTIAFVLAMRRVAPLAQSMDGLARKVDGSLDRLDAISTEVERVTRDVSRVERRVASAVDPILDQALPPLRTVAALLAGIRATVGALSRTGADSTGRDNGNQQPLSPTAKGGVS